MHQDVTNKTAQANYTQELRANYIAQRQLVRGPGNWIRDKELKHMKHQFGLPFDFPSFHDLALSAKMRVFEYEPQISWNGYFDQLTHALATATMTHTAWEKWYGASHI